MKKSGTGEIRRTLGSMSTKAQLQTVQRSLATNHHLTVLAPKPASGSVGQDSQQGGGSPQNQKTGKEN